MLFISYPKAFLIVLSRKVKSFFKSSMKKVRRYSKEPLMLAPFLLLLLDPFHAKNLPTLGGKIRHKENLHNPLALLWQARSFQS